MHPTYPVTLSVPPFGDFEGLVFIKVRRLRLSSVSGAPLTVTLNARFQEDQSYTEFL